MNVSDSREEPRPPASALDQVPRPRGASDRRCAWHRLLMRKVPGHRVNVVACPGCLGGANPLIELLRGEAPGEQVLTQLVERLLALGVADALITISRLLARSGGGRALDRRKQLAMSERLGFAQTVSAPQQTVWNEPDA